HKNNDMQYQHQGRSNDFVGILDTSYDCFIGIIHFKIEKFFPGNHMGSKQVWFNKIEERNIHST
ncbi:hypothetical protein ABTE68_20110, partial [Acinetobacter baumannii]